MKSIYKCLLTQLRFLLILILAMFNHSLFAESSPDTSSVDKAIEDTILERMRLVKNNHTRIISSFVSNQKRIVHQDLPPMPWSKSYHGYMDIDNDSLEDFGNIKKTLYPAHYIPIDIFSPKFDESNESTYHIKYTETQLYLISKAKRSNSEFHDPVPIPKGFRIAALTARTDKQLENHLPVIEKNKKVRIFPHNIHRLATIYFIPDEKAGLSDGDIGYLVKYSQYQRAKSLQSDDGAQSKTQIRYRKGHQRTETLVGSFAIESQHQMRSEELSSVEKSISRSQSQSNSRSFSQSLGVSTSIEAQAGIPGFSAKSSTKISSETHFGSRRESSQSSNQNTKNRNQNTQSEMRGQNESRTYQTTTTTTYDGQETELLTQVHLYSGKTYQPSFEVEQWLIELKPWISRNTPALKAIGIHLQPYLIASVEGVDTYVLTESKVKDINALLGIKDESLELLSQLVTVFDKANLKYPQYQKQKAILQQLRNLLDGGYYSLLTMLAKQQLGNFQLSMSKTLDQPLAPGYEFDVTNMFAQLQNKLGKWNNALHNGRLPLDLLTFLSLDTPDDINNLNASGAIKISTSSP